MINNWLQRANDETGQAMVELAFVFVVIATLIFGGIEFGRALNAWAIVTAASREGARTAAALCSMDAACGTDVDLAVTAALAGLDVTDATWTLAPGPYVTGAPVNVEVQYTLTPVAPLIAALVPGGMFTLVGATTMRLE